mmetsp:Transcript_11018/g.14389  ORF Transcript_11018/g.14389 Transcript_11018/m.14389 type:complete len:109 (+) Transcript_11018:243-569(+)
MSSINGTFFETCSSTIPSSMGSLCVGTWDGHVVWFLRPSISKAPFLPLNIIQITAQQIIRKKLVVDEVMIMKLMLKKTITMISIISFILLYYLEALHDSNYAAYWPPR